jgi:hypothetical protein
MTQFYVVLPSDSSIEFFPNNTVAHYKTKLSQSICSTGNYEVALVEIIYPINYHNFVARKQLIVQRTIRTKPNGPAFKWELKSGYFKNEEVFVDYLNKELTAEYQKIYNGTFDTLFNYDKSNKELRFLLKGELTIKGTNAKQSVNHGPYKAGFNRAISEHLGIGFNENNEDNGTFELGCPMMYIYSDIITPYSVGNFTTPLLRVVVPKGERDEIVSERFINPYYVPVGRRAFDEIEININDGQGHPISFTGGKSLVVLHFRCCNDTLLSNTPFR